MRRPIPRKHVFLIEFRFHPWFDLLRVSTHTEGKRLAIGRRALHASWKQIERRPARSLGVPVCILFEGRQRKAVLDRWILAARPLAKGYSIALHCLLVRPNPLKTFSLPPTLALFVPFLRRLHASMKITIVTPLSEFSISLREVLIFCKIV